MAKEKSSTEETKEAKPSWLTVKPIEVEKFVLDLHKHGIPPAKIGVVLRDKHGIPKAKLIGKKVKKIIQDASQSFPAEIAHVQTKIKNLERHTSQHRHDHTARRSMTKKLWIVNKLAKQQH